MSGTPFAGHLNRVSVAQLMRSEASANAGSSGCASQLGARPAGTPRPSAGASVDDAKQRTDRQRDARDEPRVKLLPSPIVHPDLPPSPSLAATDEQRAAAAIEIRLAQRERFVDAHAGAPQHNKQSAKPTTVQTIAGDPHDRNDLLDGGRVGRISQAFVTRGTTGVKAGHRRRRATATSGVEDGRSGHGSNADTRHSETGVRSPPRHGRAVPSPNSRVDHGAKAPGATLGRHRRWSDTWKAAVVRASMGLDGGHVAGT